jgi:hypothetical protein
MPLAHFRETCNYIAAVLALFAICMLIYAAIESLNNNLDFRLPRRNPFVEQEISRRERILLLSNSFDETPTSSAKQLETEMIKNKHKELDSMDVGDQNYSSRNYGAIAPLDDKEL